MKCRDDCKFYIKALDVCMFCNYTNDFESDPLKNAFEEIYKEQLRCREQEKEVFDILELDKEDEWCAKPSNEKIRDRLHNHNIDCYFVDCWGCDEIAFITGIRSTEKRVAHVLGISERCIYYDYEHCFMILNLFQEKVLREREISS